MRKLAGISLCAALCVAGLSALFSSSLIGAHASPTGVAILGAPALIWGR